MQWLENEIRYKPLQVLQEEGDVYSRCHDSCDMTVYSDVLTRLRFS